MPMSPVSRVDGGKASAVSGVPVIDWRKCLWFGTAALCACAAPFFFSWTAFIAFLLLTYFTLLLGHSVGMHRMLIHRTFRCPAYIAYPLIWLGTLVGMGGPSAIIRIHDLRDWAQRQSAYHDFFSHKRGLFRDVTWQLFYRFRFISPPVFRVEDAVSGDPFYRHLDTWWLVHQIAFATMLFLVGGMPFLTWCFGVRVVVSVVGHWVVTYHCHNPGPGVWRVSGAAVQASNLEGVLFGFLTHGECWHNNHHAFPESARIGLEPNQFDMAWLFISGLRALGLATNVGLPRSANSRDDLVRLG